ncbi:helicase-related protein [Lacrimispora sp. 210928-DFI.3.58]|uniref:helicase-related protein n=1 Tax=Lacrimispora sp. 210928-DFI.3.58 TaxID=2883214 RepID=UPI001D0975A5|nr:helicase-related protein [Lacrimispora sp. 210928-DFI.3.58]MCB7320246.1 helicase [Lacrimispora sp. 210928-DFI.3.58]
MEIKAECIDYLEEYYKDLFFGNVNKRYRSMTGSEVRARISRLNEPGMRPIAKSNELNDVHAMFAKVCSYLMRKEGHLKPGPLYDEWMENYGKMQAFCRILAKKDLQFVSDLSLEELENVLKMQGIRRYLLTNSLERAYELFYIPKTVKKGIMESVQQNPEDEYPGAREMKRRFVLHVGPTNSGKTHDALERLKACSHGAYFGPLRLLALEVYDRLNGEGLACSMITGEETLEVPGALCQACTVEMLNDHEYFDIVVVDECQMVADPYRGHNWTRAVLGLRAEEIHLCMAPEAEDIIVQMIKRCGDQYRIVRHKRNTRLTVEEKPYSLTRDLRKGDALIVFSKKSVLALAAHLENQGIHCSVIYGSLPPATRREQVRRFLEKETEVVVSTDAIGMGLNLPIRRIVFVETMKFDGVNKRTLLPEEIKQIAGRAGRFGLYDEGYVAAIDNLEVIADGLERRPIPIMKAYVGFPEQLLDMPVEIDTLIKIWAGMSPPAIYEKMEVDELLALYMNFEQVHRGHLDEFTKQEIYKLITCSVDIDNKMVMDLWKDYCREYRDVDELEFPYSPGPDLYDLESYYKMLDLYFQFSRKVGLPIQDAYLDEERRQTEEEISRILKTECASYSRKCSACGRELSWDYPFSICERCFERGKQNHPRSRVKRSKARG